MKAGRGFAYSPAEMAQKTDRGFLYNNPGIIAAIVAVLIGVGFVFAVVQSGGEHHGAPHGGAAPAAHH